MCDEDLIDEALLHVTDDTATWLRADLARHLATIIEPNAMANALSLVDEIDRLAALAEQRCVALGPEHHGLGRRVDGRPLTEHVTDRRFTTPAVLHQELDLEHWATSHARPVTTTTDPQKAAALAMAGHDQLVLVVGPAGTGKTHTTAVAVGAMEARGRAVIGLAPSGKAADVLATEARCPTDTVAGFLTRQRHGPTRWPAGTSVVLDEAGMIATDDLARLVDLVRQHRWRLVAVGDPEQLPAVGRGGMFARWCDTVSHHTLDTPHRFHEPWEAAASINLRAGRTEAVDAYAAHNRLHTTHPALVATQVARAHQRHTAAGRTVAITTNTAETARAVNREIQWLTHPGATGGIDLHDGTTVHVGDRIATRRNDPHQRTDTGQQVRNRQSWNVTAVHPDGTITAEDAERGSVHLDAAYVARHVELGWAVTGYGVQGDTVDVGLAVLEPGTTRNHAYVALTRGRQANHAVIIDPDGTTEATTWLTEVITRPVNGESALAVRDRLHHEAGIEPPALETPERPRPEVRPTPQPPDPADQAHQDKIDAAMARLDRIQYRSSRDQGRSLGL